jgi:hypothetical protein
MQVIINNKVAAVKSGSSFEYVSENRLFGGGDDYTFAITLPLAGCAVNQAIFGHINRADVVAKRIRFDCEIRCRNLVRLGTATITEITESEVKIQFLAGRSEQNFDDTWDKVYINELDLGSPSTVAPSLIDPSEAWNPVARSNESVALPWYNSDSETNIINNCAEFVDGKYEWSEGTERLSWQPYLLFLTKRICDAIGYKCDLSEWEAKEEYKYLLVCNCLPSAWGITNYASALPHWTVDEYFENLELFLFGEFDIDHREKKIKFSFTSNLMESKAVTYLDKIVDEFSISIKENDSNCDYIEAQNLFYKSCDLNMYKYYMCDDFLSSWKGKYVEYDTLDELLSSNKKLRTYRGDIEWMFSNYTAILYARDVDCHFIIKADDRTEIEDESINKEYQYRCVVQPINLLGGRIVDNSDDAQQKEIEFIPVAVDFSEDKYGYVMFLNPSGYDEESKKITLAEFRQTWIQSNIEAYTEDDDKNEYYSEIFIGWWDGSVDTGGLLPHPYVENIVISNSWDSWKWLHFNLRLNDKKSSRGKIIHNIDVSKKSTFKFLADSIPDVRSVFLIRGRRYICEKITATISEDGLSQLMKGEFWPLKD